MEIDRKELKIQARERMRLTAPAFWLVALVYFLATSGVSLATDLIPFSPGPVLGLSTTGLFVSILVTLYTTVISFGYTLWTLWTWRRMDPGIGSLLEGFSVTGRVIMLELSIMIRLFGWAMLGSLAATLVSAFFLSSSPALAMILVYGIIYVVVYAATLQYSQARYLFADRPDDGAGAAIRRSVELMRGWKWELFKLEFSFLGWELLDLAISLAVMAFFWGQNASFSTLLTGDPMTVYQFFLGDGSFLYAVLSTLASLPLFLWLTPYKGTAMAGFYEERLRLQQQSAEEMPPL